MSCEAPPQDHRPAAPPPRGAWHIRREVQLGHILTTLAIAGAATAYITKIDQRLALLEQQTIQQRDRDDTQDRVTLERTSLVRVQLDRLETKLDRLIERGGTVRAGP